MAIIQGTSGVDTLMGTDADDEIHGDAGDDVIDGLLGADRLYDDDGDDMFRFSGVQVRYPAPSIKGIVDGGSGFDAIDVSGLSPVSLGTSNNELTLTIGNQPFSVRSVESVILGRNADFIALPLWKAPLIEIHAGGGDDYFSVSGNVSAYGDEGNDRIFISSSIS